MPWLLAGLTVVVVFYASVRAFARADVRTIRSLLLWTLALAGATLAVLLVLTGRVAVALPALVMFGPLLAQSWRDRRRAASRPAGAEGDGARRRGDGAGRPPPETAGRMTREEAFAVLGLAPGAAPEAIRAAHRRLMRAAHPDSGGSDWIASRINQARDTLLG